LVFSPYSIQLASAVLHTGAAGNTRAEIATVLHYPEPEGAVLAALAEMSADLGQSKARTGTPNSSAPVTIEVVNQIFGQSGYHLRPEFLKLLQDSQSSGLTNVDFVNDPIAAADRINRWTEKKTRGLIPVIISPGTLSASTRLVATNTICLKARWQKDFSPLNTAPRLFTTSQGSKVTVPTMRVVSDMGYERRGVYSVVTIPYAGSGLQLLVVFPDDDVPLADLERMLKPEDLKMLAAAPTRHINLYMPKFTINQNPLQLANAFRRLGMTLAFSPGADFPNMSLRRGLYVEEVFHNAFMSVDEKGTAAEVATLVKGMWPIETIRLPPREIHVDRPFLFAIQHRPSGACLFLGHVVDPGDALSSTKAIGSTTTPLPQHGINGR
jgi:serpin B